MTGDLWKEILYVEAHGGEFDALTRELVAEIKRLLAARCEACVCKQEHAPRCKCLNDN